MEGVVKLWVRDRGKLVWTMQKQNLVVAASLIPRAKLLGGDTANQPISVIGFGSGTAAPAATDTVLTAPAYYKPIDSHSYPATPGQVQFNWSLDAGGAISGSWAATTALALGYTVAPGNGYYYSITTAGNTGGAQPAWGTVVGETTGDGTAVWTNQGAYDSGAIGSAFSEVALFANTGAIALPVAQAAGAGAPSLTMIAHLLLSAQINFAAGLNISGYWTESA